MEQQRDQTLRSNIKQITRYITDKITGWGFNIYVTLSHTSRSRYLEFYVGKRQSFIIRISDHPAGRNWKYDFDIYTNQSRRSAINYLDLIDILERRLFNGKVQKTG
jgi:hypothetical protein